MVCMVIIIACLFLVIRDGSDVWDGGMCVFGLMMIRSSRGVFSLATANTNTAI